MFSCFFRSVFADVFSFYLLCGVGGDSFSACGPRCFCPQLAGGLRVLRLFAGSALRASLRTFPQVRLRSAALFTARGSCLLLLFRELLCPLPVCSFCVLFARGALLLFRPFLLNFFLSKFFLFVAHAATGFSFPHPARCPPACGPSAAFVPGLRCLLSV